MSKFLLPIIGLTMLSFQVNAQKNKKIVQIPASTSAADRMASFKTRQELIENSLVKNLPFVNIGPTVMSGRVVDVDVDENDPTHFFVAYASGGLWYSGNNGISFEPMFQQEATMTIGDIAVDWKNKVIWVGSGENNSSRSSYSGNGIYKSTDWGKTWQNMGLPETQHIGRLKLHPTNPDIAWVAAIGHLYSNNKERGVYKTIDGGKTWKQTLFVDETTGAIDLAIDPKNPDVLYTSTWHRERKAWNFVEAGSTSGIYKSIDGGNTWSLITTVSSGFPTGDGVGRIGLAIYPKNPQIIYAILDNQFPRDKEKEDENKKDDYTIETFSKITKDEFAALDDKKLTTFLKGNRFPEKYTSKSVKKKVANEEIKPQAIAEFIDDPYTSVFSAPPKEAEVYRSDDAGATWKKVNVMDLKGLYNTYGYYFGQITVSPTNPDKVYIMGVPIWKSEDGAKTFKSIDAANVHSDHHSLWADPNKDGHIINGNDGGLNISYDDGKTWFKANTPAVGQFYSVNFDMAKPYNVYGGLQDNGVWMGPSNYKFDYGWYADGQYPYKRVGGGDGMQVVIDTRDNNLIYSGSQYGNYNRYNKETGERMPFQPKHDLGERPLRWNWEAPIHISNHNMDVIYFGANKLFRSLNKATDFVVISPDLTKGGKKGDVTFGTLSTVEESPMKFGLIYTGSDDGLVYVTKDGGVNWENISKGLPDDLWISQVYPSKFEEGTVYVSLNGYRWDNFNSYVYQSKDYGKTWEKIGLNLPAEPVNVIKEDPENKNIIYVGTDHGLYVSVNRGNTFFAFSGGLPAVAVHDVAVQPREHELIVASHGRSLWKADVKELEKIDADVMAKPVSLFSMESVNVSQSWGRKMYNGEFFEPKLEIPYFANQTGTAIISISTMDGIELTNFIDNAEVGLNFATYHFTFDKTKAETLKTALKADEPIKKAENDNFYLPAGKYKVTVTLNGNKATQDLTLVSGGRGQRSFEPKAQGEPEEAESDGYVEKK
nr:glycosyl hydrolase [Pseudopedobacter sp.]